MELFKQFLEILQCMVNIDTVVPVNSVVKLLIVENCAEILSNWDIGEKDWTFRLKI